MLSYFWLFFAATTCATFFVQSSTPKQPNIVVILADDMGFNDVSFNGQNQFITPNIDALAYNGIILKNHYSPNLCTPSRGSFLTGKFPSHTGLQHSLIFPDEPWGLPLNHKLMPEYFKEVGYNTHMLGKWHLGFWRKEMTPTYRGFDEYIGYYGGFIDYYDHTHLMVNRSYSRGLDFRKNLEPYIEADGIYATDLFTTEAERIIKEHDVDKPLFLHFNHLAPHSGNSDKPMQAPADLIERYDYIADPKRRAYAAMVSKLDESVGRTIKALADKGILNNTVVLFASDNGAPTFGPNSNFGSNEPLRGQKNTPFEGGVHTVAALFSPLLKHSKYVSQQVIHSVDWLPTFASLAGIELPENVKIDGINVWPILSEKFPVEPRKIVHCLDTVLGYSSYLNGHWKYINNTSIGRFDHWVYSLPKSEIDPLSANYAKEVLSSRVQTILNQMQPKPTDAQLEQLRNEAKVKCAANSVVDTKYECMPRKAPCLFNIKIDPCEQFNLASEEPEKVKQLAVEVDGFIKTAVPAAKIEYSDARADPANFNGIWNWWARSEGSGASAKEYVKEVLVFITSSFITKQILNIV